MKSLMPEFSPASAAAGIETSDGEGLALGEVLADEVIVRDGEDLIGEEIIVAPAVVSVVGAQPAADITFAGTPTWTQWFPAAAEAGNVVSTGGWYVAHFGCLLLAGVAGVVGLKIVFDLGEATEQTIEWQLDITNAYAYLNYVAPILLPQGAHTVVGYGQSRGAGNVRVIGTGTLTTGDSVLYLVKYGRGS